MTSSWMLLELRVCDFVASLAYGDMGFNENGPLFTVMRSNYKKWSDVWLSQHHNEAFSIIYVNVLFSFINFSVEFYKTPPFIPWARSILNVSLFGDWSLTMTLHSLVIFIKLKSN